MASMGRLQLFVHFIYLQNMRLKFYFLEIFELLRFNFNHITYFRNSRLTFYSPKIYFLYEIYHISRIYIYIWLNVLFITSIICHLPYLTYHVSFLLIYRNSKHYTELEIAMVTSSNLNLTKQLYLKLDINQQMITVSHHDWKDKPVKWSTPFDSSNSRNITIYEIYVKRRG